MQLAMHLILFVCDLRADFGILARSIPNQQHMEYPRYWHSPCNRLDQLAAHIWHSLAATAN